MKVVYILSHFGTFLHFLWIFLCCIWYEMTNLLWVPIYHWNDCRNSRFFSSSYIKVYNWSCDKNMLTWTTSLSANPGAKTLPHPKNTIHKVPKNSPKSSLVKMGKSPGLGNPRSWCQSIRGMTDLILAKNLKLSCNKKWMS